MLRHHNDEKESCEVCRRGSPGYRGCRRCRREASAADCRRFLWQVCRECSGALRPAVDDAFPSSVGSGVERLLKWRMIFLRSNTRTRVYSSQSGGSVLSGSVSFVSSSFLATNSSASFAAAAAHVASVSSCSLLRPTNPPQMTLKNQRLGESVAHRRSKILSALR